MPLVFAIFREFSTNDVFCAGSSHEHPPLHSHKTAMLNNLVCDNICGLPEDVCGNAPDEHSDAGMPNA